jgi:hypothetical protein
MLDLTALPLTILSSMKANTTQSEGPDQSLLELPRLQ